MKLNSQFFKALKTSVFLAIICTVCFSCDKEEDELPTENYISIENRRYVLSNGYFQNDGSYVLDGVNADLNTVLFTTEGISYNFGSDIWSGTGTGIYFWFWSTVGKELDAGTYNFVRDGDEDDAFTFSFTFFFENQSYLSDFSANQIDGGTIVITNVGNEKLIEFDLVSKGKKIEGRFKGSLSPMKD